MQALATSACVWGTGAFRCDLRLEGYAGCERAALRSETVREAEAGHNDVGKALLEGSKYRMPSLILCARRAPALAGERKHAVAESEHEHAGRAFVTPRTTHQWIRGTCHTQLRHETDQHQTGKPAYMRRTGARKERAQM